MLQHEILKVKHNKCKFGLAAVNFLGHIVIIDGIKSTTSRAAQFNIGRYLNASRRFALF